MGKIITIRNKDWEIINNAFTIQSDPKEVEKNEIKLTNQINSERFNNLKRS